MAAEETSRPFLVLGDILHDIKLVDNRQDWAKVNCLRREAYGCGEKGDRIVDGLTLYVRAGREDDPHRHPRLCIGATRGVLVCIGSEIDADLAETYGREIRLTGSLYTVAGNVMVLRVSFLTRHSSSNFRSYYLVYDSAAAALFLLPHELSGFEQTCTTLPLKVGEDKYSLLLLAATSLEGPFPSVILGWSPRASEKKSSFDECGWIVTCSIYLDLDLEEEARYYRDFTASVLFLYKGSALWGDLGLGIMYCDCSHLTAGPGSVAKLKLLPDHCMTLDQLSEEGVFDEAPVTVYRNMGCVGDSIWFVIIKPSEKKKCPGETMVCVWTLDQLSEEGEWKTHRQFKMQSIWELDGFRDQGLPETVPKYPILRQQDDGILYMLLPEDTKGRGSYGHLVGIDLSSSCGAMRLVVNRRLSIPWMDRPVVLDHDFFSPGHRAV